MTSAMDGRDASCVTRRVMSSTTDFDTAMSAIGTLQDYLSGARWQRAAYPGRTCRSPAHNSRFCILGHHNPNGAKEACYNEGMPGFAHQSNHPISGTSIGITRRKWRSVGRRQSSRVVGDYAHQRRFVKSLALISDIFSMATVSVKDFDPFCL